MTSMGGFLASLLLGASSSPSASSASTSTTSESSSFSSIVKVTTLLLIFTTYLLVVKHLRHDRVKSFEKKLQMESRESFSKMTTQQAQTIIKDLVELEFPAMMVISTIYVLIKIYGIPTISSLLHALGKLKDPATTSKRTADAGVALFELALNPVSSPRTIAAIARMNYLHSRWQKAGKISNDDMLYTLSLFALEPARWISRYEWRELSEVEKCAVGTYWKALGDDMGIGYGVLPSFESGWRDGLEWLGEVKAWSERYEAENMRFAPENGKLAVAHLQLVLLGLPAAVQGFATQAVAVLAEERWRNAIGLPEAPKVYQVVVNGFLRLRKYALRYLSPPRPYFMRKDYIQSTPDSKGRYHANVYLTYPWYVKPSLSTRLAPRAWIIRLLGRKLPGDDGNVYAPEGYRLEEIGPASLIGKGASHMQQTRDQLTAVHRGGCPFGF